MHSAEICQICVPEKTLYQIMLTVAVEDVEGVNGHGGFSVLSMAVVDASVFRGGGR